MLGRFHELSIRTDDIRASVEFYEALGFTQCRTGDTWPHPYGVLTDGRIFVGLHQYRFPSPSITCVRPGIAAAIPEFSRLGIELAFAKTGEDCFNEIGFRDPAGQMVTVLEARTYFACERSPGEDSLCGRFEAFAIPTSQPERSRAFWEQLGYVGLDAVHEGPWPHLPLVSDDLNLALHSPERLDVPALVFGAEDVAQQLERLRERGVAADPRSMPPGFEATRDRTLLRAPEGTCLLIVREERP